MLMERQPDPITALIRLLPGWVEMAIVLAAAFGLFILSSIEWAMAPPQPILTTAGDLRYLMLTEISIGVPLALFLWVRGWRPTQLGFAQPNGRDLWHPIVLLAAVFLGSWFAYAAAIAIRPELETSPLQLDETGVPLFLNVSFSLLNAFYEELFVCAYVIAAWRGSDIWTAIGISSIVRLSYHLYQGPLAIAMIFPFGVLFAWYFAHQRRLAPIIIAHAVLDVIALSQSSTG
jgi:membrane protease YdiL (CAAX protease family)